MHSYSFTTILSRILYWFEIYRNANNNIDISLKFLKLLFMLCILEIG